MRRLAGEAMTVPDSRKGRHLSISSPSLFWCRSNCPNISASTSLFVGSHKGKVGVFFFVSGSILFKIKEPKK